MIVFAVKYRGSTGVALNPFYLRQVNCLTQPERSIVEAFRLLVFGVLVNPMPGIVYDAFWAAAAWGESVRRDAFESAFGLVMISIDDVAFVITLHPDWFVAYNAAVEAGEAPVAAGCPCDSF